MSSPFEPPADTQQIELASRQRATRRRLWWIGGIVLLTPIVILVLAAISIVIWFSLRHQRATRDVLNEVARIQGNGEPITIGDMHAHQVVPAGVPDNTSMWTAVLDSFDEQQLSSDGAYVPMVGQGDKAMREVNSDAETLAATERFIGQYQRTIDLALDAADAEGECRFPVPFEEGINASMPHLTKMRSLVRLLALRLQVDKARGDKRQAIEALSAIFAATRALDEQLVIVEYLVSLAMGGVALIETEKLLNDMKLDDDELARLSSVIGRMRTEAGLTKGLIGERGTGYHSFYHLGQLAFSDDAVRPFPAEGQLTLPVDCRHYLELMGQSIDASRKPYPEALQRADQIDAGLSAEMHKPLSKLSYTVTFLLVPALDAAFEVTARNVARRDAVRCALAAERYHLRYGRPPQKLADLVPEFLSAVQIDPFDGQPIRLLVQSDELVFYSVGKNLKDDGGAENKHTAEPDVTVRLKARK